MKTLPYAKLLTVLLLVRLCALDAMACTTAMVSRSATNDGTPLLWKNRDTGDQSNKVIYVNAMPYTYLAIVNHDDSSERLAWGGVNSAGFAIEDSDAYNLDLVAKAERPNSENQVATFMADALRTCATVDDFEALVKKSMGPTFNGTSNYGVIDAHGGVASFEVSLKNYKRYDAKDTDAKYVLKTNFSWIGPDATGHGYTRFDRETTLFNKANGNISNKFVLEGPARDLGSNLLHNPSPADWKTFPADTPYWVQADFTIDRDTTASTILIRGVHAGEDPLHSTLWIILGEPLCSIAVPLWVAAGQTPAEVREGADAPIAREALRLKHILRPLKGVDNFEFVDVTKLDNASGTGWLPENLKVEQEILDATQKFLAGNPSPAEMAVFEKKMAAIALARLQEVHSPAGGPMATGR